MDQKELLTVVYREMLEKAIPSYMEDSYCALMDYCHAHTDTISENVRLLWKVKKRNRRKSS